MTEQLANLHESIIKLFHYPSLPRKLGLECLNSTTSNKHWDIYINNLITVCHAAATAAVAHFDYTISTALRRHGIQFIIH